MARQWNIQPPAKQCAVTQRPFRDEEPIVSVLVESPAGLDRRDYSLEAWDQLPDRDPAVSFWKTEFKLRTPADPQPDALRRDDAESLLRRLLDHPDLASHNAPYILALMLERKRLLKPIDKVESHGVPILIYEHARTGETITIRDPQLRLDQLDAVQTEVVALLDAPPGVQDGPEPNTADPS